MTKSTPGNLPKWKKVLFAIVACALFFVALEIVLALCGVRPILYERDPYVGFSSHIPLFVERQLPDGTTAMVTARNKLNLFNTQQFPEKKPDRTFRIFCVGGSTTYGRPYNDKTSFCGWLRDFLPVVDPSRRWEVINAGGISYASYRVSVLMEELVRYQPDLFVVYTGQNEFLEQRTYAKIIKVPAPVRGLGALASHTRIWTAMKAVVDKISAVSKARNKPATELPGEVATLLDRSVGPNDYTRDDTLRSEILAHYRFSLARIVDIARSAGAGALLITPASNLRDCSPFKSEHRAGLTSAQLGQWQSCVKRAEQARQSGHLEESLKALNEAAQIDGRYAGLQFLRGKTFDALKRFAEAKVAYQRALDEDICPLRALSPMHTIVSEVASNRNVPLVDFAALVEKRAKNGIPGYDLFLDHVHPTIEMDRELALAIIETMVKKGYVHPRNNLQKPWPRDPEILRVTQDVESHIDLQEHGAALRKLAIVMAWAGKFEDGYQAARRAVQLAPDDLEAHFELARCALVLGKLDEAEKHFNRVLRDPVAPGRAPYYYAESHLDLGVLCERRGQLDQAESHYLSAVQLRPDFAPAHNDLGVFYKRRGNLSRAEAEYRTALRIQPEFPEACLNLGILLEERGKFTEAATLYRRALRIRPDYPKASRRLRELLGKQTNH